MTSSAPGPLVLIVDDNERNLKLASDVLKAAGFRILAAVDGAGALALAKEEIPDLVLLDLRLPDLDGADVARALARGARTRDIPVVALSALPDKGEPAPCFAGYVEKPISVAAFPEQVRAYCRGASTPPTGKRPG
jgi:two-component system cell cycle response regulator DivK